MFRPNSFNIKLMAGYLSSKVLFKVVYNGVGFMAIVSICCASVKDREFLHGVKQEEGRC